MVLVAVLAVLTLVLLLVEQAQLVKGLQAATHCLVGLSEATVKVRVVVVQVL